MPGRILMIIASSKFRDEEYAEPKKVFEEKGFSVTTASSTINTCTGMLGMIVKPDILIDRANPVEYDAVVFVGGGGAREYFDNKMAHDIAKKTVSLKKVLGAICIAPSILANAGLLHGKKAVVFVSEANNLTSKGAILQPYEVARDGKIITATGPAAAKAFGEAVVNEILSV